MQSVKIFQIDAFTDKVFHGNPAAICLLDDWLNDELLQAIAAENNLSETAFVIRDSRGYQIRWFTPNGEINLCGHATLAAAFLLFELGSVKVDAVNFASLSGPLQVRKKGKRLTLELPAFHTTKLHEIQEWVDIIDKPIVDVFVSELDYLILLAHQSQVLQAQIDLKALLKQPKRGLIVTAKGDEVDFYSRCFYPKHNIPEDPVTGSAHCILAPFWSERLQKKQLHALQGAFRKGEVFCEVMEDRVYVSGYCKWYMKGHLVI